MAAATCPGECNASVPTLYVAFELSNATWKVAATSGRGTTVRHKSLPARDGGGVQRELAAAKRRLGLPGDARVVSCYEAGRDGFGPHRLLATLGVENLVVDPASIEVSRRQRRAKTDKLDAAALLRLLVAYLGGEPERLRVVRVPSVEVEDARQLHRELESAKTDVTRVRNRITSLIAAQGGEGRIEADFLAQVEGLRLPDGRRLAPQLRARLRREWDVLRVLEARVVTLEEARHARVVEGPDRGDRAVERVRQLMRLKGVGEGGSWFLVKEFLWREFHNRREVGGAAGLTPTPYASGETQREQGISKAGNPRVRRMMVQLAWSWVRWQPDSALTRWFLARFGGGTRHRRVGIVAVARRLLIACWRFLETGELPPGAVLKPAR